MSDVTFTFSGDSSNLQAAFNDIKSSVASTKQAAAGLSSAMAATFAAMATAIAGSFMAINASAQRENLSTAFIPLLGSADAAQERMKELAHFAATTPFQINEVAKASKTLQTLTDGALATGAGLRLVGDIASSTNTPFAEIAVTVGRLYSGLDSGRPVGEAMARLQELGAISPQVRSQLEDLQKAGKKGNEVWQVAVKDLSRFSSAIELQSATWAGKVSTMSDAWEELLVKVGQPLMLALAPALEALSATFENLSGTATQFGEGLGTIFAKLAQGINTALSVIVPFAEGLSSVTEMLGGTQTVVASLAAALLIYGRNTQIAASNTISFTAQLAKLSATFKGLSIASIAQSFKTGFASILTNAKASAFGMRTVWSITMTTMATVTRTAMLAIKAAFISTGVGLLIVGIGEALAAVYSWWNKNKEAAQQAVEAAQAYKKTMDDFHQQAQSIKTEEERLALMKQMEQELKNVNEQLEEARSQDNDKLSEELENQITSLNTHIRLYKDILPLQVAQAEAAERKTRALQKQNEEMAKLIKQNEKATEQLIDLSEKEEAKNLKKSLSNIQDPETQLQARLYSLDVDDMSQLKSEIEQLIDKAKNTLTGITPEELKRYKQLLATQQAIVSLEERASKEKERQQQIAIKAKYDYDMRVALLKAEITNNNKRIEQIKQEQRLK